MENINDLEEQISKFQGDKDSREFKSLEIVLTQKLRTLYRARRDYVPSNLRRILSVSRTVSESSILSSKTRLR